ncbi:MAG: glycosyltransferase, partial [Nitrospira sp.]|nr:glycosyltransferase [Nitrospira sp.]
RLLLPVLKGLLTDTLTLRHKAQVLRDILYTGLLFDEVQLFAPDILFAHFAGTRTNLAMFHSLLSGVPYGFKMHAADVFTRVGLLRLKCKHAAWIGTISNFNLTFLKRVNPEIDFSKVNIHKCGLPLDRFAYSPKEKSTVPRRMVAVGRMVRTKGFDTLVKASHELRQRGIDHTLIIIGDGPQRPELERLISSLGLHDTVRLLGYCSPREVQAILAEADAFVLPVGWDPILKIPEGVPVALMEAMAVGIPVVSGRTAGIPELIADGMTGFLANSGDPSDLAEVVDRVFWLPSEDRGTLTLAAREKIVSDHDIVSLTHDLHVSLTRCVRSHG